LPQINPNESESEYVQHETSGYDPALRRRLVSRLRAANLVSLRLSEESCALAPQPKHRQSGSNNLELLWSDNAHDVQVRLHKKLAILIQNCFTSNSIRNGCRESGGLPTG